MQAMREVPGMFFRENFDIWRPEVFDNVNIVINLRLIFINNS